MKSVSLECSWNRQFESHTKRAFESDDIAISLLPLEIYLEERIELGGAGALEVGHYLSCLTLEILAKVPYRVYCIGLGHQVIGRT